MSGLDWLVELGIVLLATGTVGPLIGLSSSRTLALQALGIGLLGLGGALVLFGAAPIGAGFHDNLSPAFGIDGLSGFFLATLAMVAVPALLYARDYLAGAQPCAGPGRPLRLVSALPRGVVTARDPSTFLACWELMTLAPGRGDPGPPQRRRGPPRRLRLPRGHPPRRRRASGSALLALAHYGALGDPGALAAQGAGVQALIVIAAIVGFGTKAGLMPLHSWLPRAHPVAPSHISALMSGVMIKVALYGLIRVLFEWAAPAPLWVGPRRARGSASSPPWGASSTRSCSAT